MMKNYIIPICALLMVGCGNRQVKQSTEKTITTVVNDTNAKPLAITSSSDSNQISDEDSIYLMAFEPLSSNLSSFSPEKKLPNTPLMKDLVDLYNGALILNSIWCDFELWVRFDTYVKDVIKRVDCSIISNSRIRKYAQTYKDRIVAILPNDTTQVDSIKFTLATKEHNIFKAALVKRYNINHYGNLSNKQYEEIYDKNNVIPNYDSIYFKRGNQDRLYTAHLKQMANNESDFTKKCIYTLESMHVESAEPTEEIIKPLENLMQSKQYSIYLIEVWRTWRCLFQSLYGPSKDSAIPNYKYNDMRMICANTILHHIVAYPNDMMAINQFLTLSSIDNIYRYGEFPMGNQSILEEVFIFPERYNAFWNEKR